MALQTRSLQESVADTDAWSKALNVGFLNSAPVSEEEKELRRTRLDLRRARGVFDGERCVATYRSFDQRLTVPGGEVAANAVTGVTVTSTHRRRGLLSGLITEDLRAAKERGDLVATLIAAEYGIYGRFGFGPASSAARWRVDTAEAGTDPRWSRPECGGSVAFADASEVLKAGPVVHERFRTGQPGAVSREPLFWERYTGQVTIGPRPAKEPFFVIYRDPAGRPAGLLSFTVEVTWDAGVPDGTASVQDLVADGPHAERALWFFLLSLDWVRYVDSGRRAPDDLLPDLLPMPRAARITEQADFLWMRPLDVPGLLRARHYRAAGRLVFEVSDPLGLASGRFALTATGSGGAAECEPTTQPADLLLDTGTLSALYLGDASAVRLSALGRLTERRAGAAGLADLLLRTSRRPWCPDMF